MQKNFDPFANRVFLQNGNLDQGSVWTAVRSGLPPSSSCFLSALFSLLPKNRAAMHMLQLLLSLWTGGNTPSNATPCCGYRLLPVASMVCLPCPGQTKSGWLEKGDSFCTARMAAGPGSSRPCSQVCFNNKKIRSKRRSKAPFTICYHPARQ